MSPANNRQCLPSNNIQYLPEIIYSPPPSPNDIYGTLILIKVMLPFKVHNAQLTPKIENDHNSPIQRSERCLNCRQYLYFYNFLTGVHLIGNLSSTVTIISISCSHSDNNHINLLTVISGVARIFCGEVLFTNKRNFFVGMS